MKYFKTQSNWLNNNSNNVTVLQMHAYLALHADLDGNYTNDAKDFANNAMEASMNGGEVDFEEQVILDESFVDNECLKSVYDDMGKASTFKEYLKNFDGDMSVANLKFVTSTDLSLTTNAETSPPNNYLITITFNENNLNRPSLSVARTMIHEMIHAEIFRKLLSVYQHPSLTGLTYQDIENMSGDYPGLYDYYMRWKNNIPAGMNLSSPQHQAMAEHYRDIIKQALKEFDNTQVNDVYDALSWVGLKNTIAWNNLTDVEKNNINQTISTFNSNNSNCQ